MRSEFTRQIIKRSGFSMFWALVRRGIIQVETSRLELKLPPIDKLQIIL